MTPWDMAFQILLVEDNPSDVLLTREALKGWKIEHCLHVVEDGEEALDFLFRRGPFCEAVRPDLIILDLNLPKLDGKEVMLEIKRDPGLSTIPLVVVTTSDAVTDKESCYALGAKLYITKPLNLQEYVAAICAIEESGFSPLRT